MKKSVTLQVVLSALFILHTVGLNPNDIHAQAPVLQWAKTYGGQYDDYGFDIEVLRDGYLIGAHTKSFGHGNDKYDVYLVKTNENGNMLWAKTFGGDQNEQLLSLKQVHDGGFVIAGSTQTWCQGGSDAYVVRVDKNGDSLWTNHYGNFAWDQFYSAAPTDDQGFIFSGYSTLFPDGDQMYIVKTDNNGDTLWTTTIGGSSQDYGFCVLQAETNDYASVGHTWSQGNESMGYLVRTNEQGHVSWWNAFGDAGEEYCRWMDQNEDRSFTIVGSTSSWGHGSDDFWLMFTDVDGMPVQWHTYGGSSSDIAYGASRDIDNGILMAGSTWSFNVEPPDIFFMKTNAEGDSLWAVTWGDEDWQYAYTIKPTFDGGYIIIGRTYSIFNGDTDIQVLKYGPTANLLNVFQQQYGLDLPILDEQLTTDDMEIALPAGSIVTGLTVYIDTIMHGEVKELMLCLSHEGIIDTLMLHPTVGGSNIINMMLHPAASCNIKAGQAPFTGVYKPFRSPSCFNGTEAGGNWQLQILDTAAGNTGTLQAWGLKVFYEPLVGMEEKQQDTIREYLKIYPNPFTSQTAIHYALQRNSHVGIGLYNLQGKEILKLKDASQEKGEYSIELNSESISLVPGIYLCRMQTGRTQHCVKLVHLH